MDHERYRRGLTAYAGQFQISPDEVEARFVQRVGERFSQDTILSAAGAWVDDELSLRDRN